jgi:hypothetical protein
MPLKFELCNYALGEAIRKNEMVNHPICFLKMGFCDKTQSMMFFSRI